MVRLTRIYTRGGDRGETSLGGGERVAKHDLRVAAFGTVDEANSAVGVARLHTLGTALDAMLARIQNDLFDLGADLCTPEGGTPEGGTPEGGTRKAGERKAGAARRPHGDPPGRAPAPSWRRARRSTRPLYNI